ncbi:MAG: GAP family protein [Ilumatobacteraceae bacterium]
MGPLLAEVAVLGLLSGLDPLGFIAVVVVSAQDKRNGVAFCAGWLLTLAALALAPGLVFHGHVTRHHARATHRHLLAWLFLVVGVALVGLAIHAWRLSRRQQGDEVPRWYRRLQRVGPKTSFVTGLVLPSFPAALAAGTAVFHSDRRLTAQLLVIVVFLACSSINVIPPTVVLEVRPGAAPALSRLNNWAYLRRHTITFVVLGAIGVFLIARSVFRLTHGV